MALLLAPFPASTPVGLVLSGLDVGQCNGYAAESGQDMCSPAKHAEGRILAKCSEMLHAVLALIQHPGAAQSVMDCERSSRPACEV